MPDDPSAVLWNGTTGQRLARVDPRRSAFALALGWIGRRPPSGVALQLAPCARIHTFGVPEAIDVAHCAADGTVLRIDVIAPNQVGPSVPGTCRIWESRAGSLVGRVAVGDRLERRVERASS